MYYRSPLHNPWVYLALPFGSQGASCPPLILPDSDSRKNNHPKIGGGGIQSIATAVYHFLSTILTDLRENHILCRHDIYWSVKIFICAFLRQLTCFARQQIFQRSCVFLKYGNYTEQRERVSQQWQHSSSMQQFCCEAFPAHLFFSVITKCIIQSAHFTPEQWHGMHQCDSIPVHLCLAGGHSVHSRRGSCVLGGVAMRCALLCTVMQW